MAGFHCLTFLTDCGLEDAFVAICHGVASQIAPDVRIIDITDPGCDRHAGPGRETVAPFVTAFGDVAPGELLCYRDSGDWVAIAVSEGDAAGQLGLRAGTKVTITAPASGGTRTRW